MVTFAFQVSLHLLEDQPGIAINNSANIFRKDPSGTYFANCSKHLRPEVAIVPVSSPLPRVAEGLTGKSARKDINLPFVIAVICFPDVAIAFCLAEMIFQSLLTKWVDLTMKYVLPTHPCRSQIKTAHSAEKAGVPEYPSLHIPLFAPTDTPLNAGSNTVACAPVCREQN
ncbi:MAG TPA: hypothetical protein VIR29_03650 [Anseongella sp.]